MWYQLNGKWFLHLQSTAAVRSVWKQERWINLLSVQELQTVLSLQTCQAHPDHNMDKMQWLVKRLVHLILYHRRERVHAMAHNEIASSCSALIQVKIQLYSRTSFVINTVLTVAPFGPGNPMTPGCPRAPCGPGGPGRPSSPAPP